MLRLIPLLFVLAFSTACAKSEPELGSPVTTELSAAEVKAKLLAARPDLILASIVDSDVTGFYLAQVSNGPEIYLSKDGNHLISGDIFKVSNTGLVDLKEQRLAVVRQQAVSGLATAETITFSPEGEVKASIYVFTDVDCGYCQKLHREMEAYNAAGIEVRYLAYPRAGLNSPAFNKIASAWCAADPNAAMTKLKQRQSIPENVCDKIGRAHV